METLTRSASIHYRCRRTLSDIARQLDAGDVDYATLQRRGVLALDLPAAAHPAALSPRSASRAAWASSAQRTCSRTSADG